jgi:hypothetical protein
MKFYILKNNLTTLVYVLYKTPSTHIIRLMDHLLPSAAAAAAAYCRVEHLVGTLNFLC